MNPQRIIDKYNDRMLVWLTGPNLLCFKMKRYVHLHTTTFGEENHHLGDWELLKVYPARYVDYRKTEYMKCLVKKLVE
jgi:hypothetical protein